MMSPNKNKRGAAAIREASPEADPVSPKNSGSSLSGDETEENVSNRGGTSLYGSSSLRSFSFSGQRKPAELFRKDLISAMKLADKDALPEESYCLISDPWRQEWEKGVQVPVNVTDIKGAKVKELQEKTKTGDFKMPHKLLHERMDEVYKKGQHMLTGMPELAEQLVRYDLDDLDVCWLHELNFRFREMGLNQISEWNMERIIEALENECHRNMTEVMKTEEGMGIEYDEDIVCDVCRSPESEESNEMVFCDKCDICIHQACYGIQTIPQGSWLCRTCAVGVKPSCMLCPNLGGAMKCTRSGTRWVHVSCALWIPEVEFGDPDKMEPVIKISHIPPSRWSLTCCLCKERVGACIQCSVKSCKTAFHVTCAFSNSLVMKTVLDEKAGDDVKLKGFCPKHSKRRERTQSDSEPDTPRKKGLNRDSPRKGSPRKDSPPTPRKLTQEERANLRTKKLRALEEEFYKVVDVSVVSKTLQLEEEVVSVVFFYWKLKRKGNWDKPLLTPKTEEEDILEKQEEDSRVARMKMFVHLRHDLERVRNLCYMISKREKMKRQLFHNKEHVFKNMARVLKNKSLDLSKANINDIVQNYHFDSIYDDYGRSVQKLPGELSEEEKELSEVEENVSAGVNNREKAEKVVQKAGKRTRPLKLFSEDKESEDTPKLGQARGTRRKVRRKNATAKKLKELKNQVLASALDSSVSPLKRSGLDTDDDHVQIMSADESEDEAIRRLPGLMTVTASRGYLWSVSDIFSPTPRRFRQKKPRRGRKPWYEKRSSIYELNPNLALSTDDDEDTKGSFEGCGESLGADEGNASEDVLVDVIGEGDADKTIESIPAKFKVSNDRSRRRGQKPISSREVNNNRRKYDKMLRTKFDTDQTTVGTRTELNDVAPKCTSNLKKSGSLEQVKGPKEGEDACGVLPHLPTRTGNRKRRNLNPLVSGPECTHSEDSVHEEAMTDISEINTESSHEEERSVVSPSKRRKSSRSGTRKGKMDLEYASDMKELKADMRKKFAELHDEHQFLVPTRQQPVASNLPSDSTQSATVNGGSKSHDSTSGETCSEMTEENETTDGSVSGEREHRVSVRQGRQSSHRARLMWNERLMTASPSAGGQNKFCKSIQEKSPQPQVKGRRTSSSSQSVMSPQPQQKRRRTSSSSHSQTSTTSTRHGSRRTSSSSQSVTSPQPRQKRRRTSSSSHSQTSTTSTRHGSVGRIKIKQEKDAETPLERTGLKKEQDLEGKSSTIHTLDLKVNDSKKLTHSGSRNINERVKNGYCKQHSKQGRRRLLNGVVDNKQSKIDSFFSKMSVESLGGEVDQSSSVKLELIEMTPEKRGSWRDSHSGGPARNSVGKCNREQLSEHARALASSSLQPGGEGSEKSDSVRRKASPSGELEAVSTFTKGQCESDKFSMDTLRAFRSQSPSSDASTITGLLIDSRESTPRRFTRSQQADAATENSPCLRNGDARNRTKTRNHRSKSSKAL